MRQQRGFARRGWAFEWRRRDADDHAAAPEACQYVAHRERTRHRVELVTSFDQPRCGRRIQISSQGDDHHVGVERPGVGLDAPGRGVNRTYRRPDEPHAGLDQVAVGVDDRLRDGAPEHHVELGEAEHEPVGLIDQHHLDLVAELLGKPRRQLQPAETRTQHQDTHHRLPSEARRRHSTGGCSIKRLLPPHPATQYHRPTGPVAPASQGVQNDRAHTSEGHLETTTRPEPTTLPTAPPLHTCRSAPTLPVQNGASR